MLGNTVGAASIVHRFLFMCQEVFQISDGHERVLKIVFILHKIKLNE